MSTITEAVRLICWDPDSVKAFNLHGQAFNYTCGQNTPHHVHDDQSTYSVASLFWTVLQAASHSALCHVVKWHTNPSAEWPGLCGLPSFCFRLVLFVAMVFYFIHVWNIVLRLNILYSNFFFLVLSFATYHRPVRISFVADRWGIMNSHKCQRCVWTHLQTVTSFVHQRVLANELTAETVRVTC